MTEKINIGALSVYRSFYHFFLFSSHRWRIENVAPYDGYRLILTRLVACHRPMMMITRSRFVALDGDHARPTFLFAGSDAYCKRFQALLSILLTLLPAIPQLQYVSGQLENSRMKSAGRPPRVIRFRCFVRFAGSRPSPSSSHFCPRFPSSTARVLHSPPPLSPSALVPHGCLSISIPYTVRSLFIYRFNEHVRDKASRNIDIGWSIPVRLAVPCWRVLHLLLEKKKKINRSQFRAMCIRNEFSISHRDER